MRCTETIVHDDGEPIARLEDYRPKRRFMPIRFKDIKLNTDRPSLVNGALPREGLVVIGGVCLRGGPAIRARFIPRS